MAQNDTQQGGQRSGRGNENDSNKSESSNEQGTSNRRGQGRDSEGDQNR